MAGDAFSGAQRLHALHALSPRSGKKRPMQSKPLSPELALNERVSHLSFADEAFRVALGIVTSNTSMQSNNVILVSVCVF
jgi:hypothetical protein